LVSYFNDAGCHKFSIKRRWQVWRCGAVGIASSLQDSKPGRAETSRPVLRRTQLPVHLATGVPSRDKAVGVGASHVPASSAEIKELSGAIPLLPLHIFRQ